MERKKSKKKKVKAKRPPWRPTKWKKEYNEMIVKFFEQALEQPYIIHYDKFEKPHHILEPLPTLESFAHSIDVDIDTMERWAKDEKKYPGFCGAFARAKEIQKNLIIVRAEAGASNAGFATFLLKNNHGMKDKSEVDQNVKIDNLQDVINQAYEQANNAGDTPNVAKEA
ncbi:MAG: terminase small subunit [Patescibacteria group bacterium]